jgi:hypothetical protein
MALAPFKPDDGIIITRVANGGYVVQASPDMGSRPVTLGAYTSAGEMLDDLQDALWELTAPGPAPEEHPVA